MKILLFSLVGLLVTVNAWESGCGKRASEFEDAEFIVGGQNAAPGQWPWTVSVRSSSGGSSHFCGGIIIRSSFVLTAAHCVENSSPSRVKAVVGEHDRSSGNSYRVVHDVSAIYIHEWYDVDYEMDYDVALLALRYSIRYNSRVNPACKPQAGNSYVGYTSYCSGWGALWSGGPSPNILQYVDFPIIGNSDCRNRLRPADVTASMLCAGGMNGKDSCQGDSGGPLVVQRGSRWEVVGIVSWGFGCAENLPGVYARVDQVLGWIDSTMLAHTKA